MTQVIAISSAASAVGATTVATGLAIALARHGQKTCLLDADWGPGSAGALLKYHPEKTLVDLLDGKAVIEQVVQHNVCGMDVILGDLAAERMSALTSDQLVDMAVQLSKLKEYDYLVIDVAFGADRTVASFLEASDVMLLVITPDRKSQDGAYALLKRLREQHAATSVMAVVNQCRNQIIGRHAYARLREITEFYLQESVPLLGLVCDAGKNTLTSQQAVEKFCSAASDLDILAEKILLKKNGLSTQPMQAFWRRYLKAAGIDKEYVAISQPDSTFDSLELQLDSLSERVETLIARVNQCKEFLNEQQMPSPSTVPVATDLHSGPEYWLSDLEYELTAQDEVSGPYYLIRQSAGTSIRCAYYKSHTSG